METFIVVGGVTLQVLGWLVFSYAFVSFFEWQIHRHLMHRKRFPKWVYRFSPYILETFEAHAVRHHGQYYDEFDHEPDPAGREYNLDIKVGETVTIVICLAPVFALIFWLSPLGGSILLGMSVLHNQAWNLLHREMHIPQHGWLGNTAFFRFLARHHFLHHEQTSKNYNIVFPLFDYVFFTTAKPNFGDIREMLRLGYLTPRHMHSEPRLERWRDEVAERREELVTVGQ